MSEDSQTIEQDDVATAESINVQAGPAIPNIIVRVRAGCSVCDHDEVTRNEGDEFETQGPSAIALVQAGIVDIVGSATS